jgi:hypothetical protein
MQLSASPADSRLDFLLSKSRRVCGVSPINTYAPCESADDVDCQAVKGADSPRTAITLDSDKRMDRETLGQDRSTHCANLDAQLLPMMTHHVQRSRIYTSSTESVRRRRAPLRTGGVWRMEGPMEDVVRENDDPHLRDAKAPSRGGHKASSNLRPSG